MSAGHSPFSASPYVDEEDIDEIISQHLQQGRVVERLRLK